MQCVAGKSHSFFEEHQKQSIYVLVTYNAFMNATIAKNDDDPILAVCQSVIKNGITNAFLSTDVDMVSSTAAVRVSFYTSRQDRLICCCEGLVTACRRKSSLTSWRVFVACFLNVFCISLRMFLPEYVLGDSKIMSIFHFTTQYFFLLLLSLIPFLFIIIIPIHQSRIDCESLVGLYGIGTVNRFVVRATAGILSGCDTRSQAQTRFAKVTPFRSIVWDFVTSIQVMARSGEAPASRALRVEVRGSGPA